MRAAALVAILLSTADGGPSVSPRVEAPASVKMGEVFDYSITVPHAAGEVLGFPPALELGDFEVQDRSREEKASASPPETVLHLKLRGWALGKAKIPDLVLDAQGPAGLSHVAVPGPELSITGALDPDGGAEAPMRDIAPPVSVKIRTYRALVAAGALLGLLAAAWGLRRWLRRPRPEPVVVARHIPPEERAAEALHSLLAADLPGKGQQREFYFRLSEIVRRYVGERFAFDAIDLTSDELLAELGRRQTPGLEYAQFADFCREADLAKFAKLKPEVAACKASFEAAQRFVNATTRSAATAGEVGT